MLLDEYYTYDRLNRLTGMTRGDLDGTYPNYTGIAGGPTALRTYSLDSLGNWASLSASFDIDLAQTRTHNSVNEITHITEYEDDPWIDATYNARGNMTTVPIAKSPPIWTLRAG